mmetsp:Transcript_20475/g.28585  ORF Transcript_20475/g.28585 Transcript_20475/m.28585 type:complete len:173 (-) Transcript_20475:195-713(-)|eukprot:CAMPEP_0184480558 /NCGR_PEP_ID=MMETSP0113_2-20130426/2054_1 /TAXON_ID=91329 /ORGANISM="Norrisiella sphaerica, Strain BC52" /LENGTH=172 /DNA_ID=CAMNT_0026859103 /DNA_START=55 /DNA_END=573 /DNA_ORIENTATION=+
MPGYEILCIAKVTKPETYARIFKKASGIVLRDGGLIRGIDNLGTRPLPYRMKAHTKYNYYGNFFKFRIQASPSTLFEVDKSFRADEDMIRWTPLKQPRRVRVEEPFTGVRELKTETEQRKFLRQHLPLDYSIAKELLREGKITKEELESTPTKKWVVPSYFKQQNTEGVDDT